MRYCAIFLWLAWLTDETLHTPRTHLLFQGVTVLCIILVALSLMEHALEAGLIEDKKKGERWL